MKTTSHFIPKRCATSSGTLTGFPSKIFIKYWRLTILLSGLRISVSTRLLIFSSGSGLGLLSSFGATRSLLSDWSAMRGGTYYSLINLTEICEVRCSFRSVCGSSCVAVVAIVPSPPKLERYLCFFPLGIPAVEETANPAPKYSNESLHLNEFQHITRFINIKPCQ